MKAAFLFVALMFFNISLVSQDDVRVMQYNLLYYGAETSWCNCYNNSVEDKNEYIRTILDAAQPDILTVCEFGNDYKLIKSFLDENLNINGVNSWKSSSIINKAGSDIINCIFYDSEKLSLKRHSAVETVLRDIDVYELYFNTKDLIKGDTVDLICVVAHLKAGGGDENRKKRLSMADSAMSYINENYKNENVLFMGDFNFYTSAESAYRLITDRYTYPDSYFIDPLYKNGVGKWNNNEYFKKYHTQSTNSKGGGCATSGGLDDRFDFILMSENISEGSDKLQYVPNSYHAFGNDGKHFKMSINEAENKAVSKEVADALYHSSDHLPIIMELKLGSKLK